VAAGVALAFLLLVDIATFSRSGGVGLIAGALVLVLPYRRFLRSKQFLYPLGGLAVVLLGVLYLRSHFFETFLSQRLSTSGRSTSAHFAVYDFIGQILHMHPLLGLGNNNFSVYYEFVTGRRTSAPTRTGSRSSSSRAPRPRPLDRLPPLRLPRLHAARHSGGCSTGSGIRQALVCARSPTG
jgi:Lipid A core - O-antigen ligase and related enzymes